MERHEPPTKYHPKLDTGSPMPFQVMERGEEAPFARFSEKHLQVKCLTTMNGSEDKTES